MNEPRCIFDGCGRYLVARKLCSTHYNQQRRGEKLRPITGRGGRDRVRGPCGFDGCRHNAKAKGMCEGHRQQQLRGKELRPLVVRIPRSPCQFESCDRLAISKKLCEAHYAQLRRGQELRALFVPKYRYIHDGYVMLYDPAHPNAAKSSGMVMEHTKVMADHIGRPLLRDETCHHKNGDRSDNRLSNLELWSTKQPKGQRATDKVEFAAEMLRRYAPELLKEPSDHQ